MHTDIFSERLLSLCHHLFIIHLQKRVEGVQFSYFTDAVLRQSRIVTFPVRQTICRLLVGCLIIG